MGALDKNAQLEVLVGIARKEGWQGDSGKKGPYNQYFSESSFF
jgi:hypothetical protein